MYSSTVTNLSKLSKAEVWRFFNSFDTIITDCEGVLWVSSNKVVLNVPEVLNRFRAIGKRFFFVTNSSTRKREEIVLFGKSLGYSIYKNEVISSSYLTAMYLKRIGFNKTAYVIGSHGLVEELENLAIKYVGPGPDIVHEDTKTTIENIKIHPGIGAVIVGFDKHFSYPKIVKAATYLKDPECLFLNTNSEERFPTHGRKILPDAGSLVKAIETVSGRKSLLIGKPSTFISEALITEHCIDPERTLLIGDRMDTDIVQGSKCGFQTMLVLTGSTNSMEIEKLKLQLHYEPQFSDNEKTPDVYVQSLGDLLPYLGIKQVF